MSMILQDVKCDNKECGRIGLLQVKPCKNKQVYRKRIEQACGKIGWMANRKTLKIYCDKCKGIDNHGK